MDHIPDEPPKSLKTMLWHSCGFAMSGAFATHLLVFQLADRPAADRLAPLVGLASGLLGLAVLIARNPSDEDSDRERRSEKRGSTEGTPASSPALDGEPDAGSGPKPVGARKRSRMGLPALLGLQSLGFFSAIFLLIAAVRAMADTQFASGGAMLFIVPIALLLMMFCLGAGLVAAVSALAIAIFRILRGDEENESAERQRRAERRRKRRARTRSGS